MTVMSEGLLLKSKYIKMGRAEGGFQAFLTQPPRSVSAHRVEKNAKSQGMPKLNMSDMSYLITDLA